MRWLDDDLDDGGPIDGALGVPDAIAVYDDDGQLFGWDVSAACSYLADRGTPCDDECVARDHIERW